MTLDSNNPASAGQSLNQDMPLPRSKRQRRRAKADRGLPRLSFKEIAQRLGVSQRTIVRAYDQGSPQAVREAAERGQRPRRGRYSHLKPEVFEPIRTGLDAGEAAVKIAAEVGCGVSTVYRVANRCSLPARNAVAPTLAELD